MPCCFIDKWCTKPDLFWSAVCCQSLLFVVDAALLPQTSEKRLTHFVCISISQSIFQRRTSKWSAPSHFRCTHGSFSLDPPRAQYWMFTTLLMQIDTTIIWASLIAAGQISACPTDAVIAFISCVRLRECHGCLTFHGPIHNIKHFTVQYVVCCC